MDVLALFIAGLAAAFTATQWAEARRSRIAAVEANKLAKKAQELAEAVESRQLREEHRAAVTWRPRLHPRYRGNIQFENTGHSNAYDVVLEADDLSAVRHERLHTDWKLEPGEFHALTVRYPSDLDDMPDSVRISYKLEKYGVEATSQIVSLAGLLDDFKQLAAEDRKWRIEDPIRYEAEHSAYLRIRAEAVAAQEAATKDQRSAATAPPLADVPAQPSDPVEEPAPEQQ